MKRLIDFLRDNNSENTHRDTPYLSHSHTIHIQLYADKGHTDDQRCFLLLSTRYSETRNIFIGSDFRMEDSAIISGTLLRIVLATFIIKADEYSQYH